MTDPKTIRLIIEGKPCPKNNKHRVYANAHGIGRSLSAEYKDFRMCVHSTWCQARARGAHPFDKGQQVRLKIAAYWPTKRSVDVDAAVETTMDALTYAGAWDDDRQVVALLATKHYDKERPRVEVEIVQLEGKP